MFFYNKKRSKELEKNVFNDNENFYKSNISLNDLKMLVTNYGEVKNIKIFYPKLALSALTTMELMVSVFICTIMFMALLAFFSILVVIPLPLMFSFFIQSIFLFFAYRYMLVKGIKNFLWWEQFKPNWERPSILLKFMKEQITIDEKKLIIDKCSVKSQSKKEEMRENYRRKRL